MSGPKVGDERQMTPREMLERAACRFTLTKLCYAFRVGKVTKEDVQAEGDALEGMSLSLAAEDLLGKGAV